MRTRPVYLFATGLLMAAIAVFSLVFLDPSGGQSAAQEAQRDPVGNLSVGEFGGAEEGKPTRATPGRGEEGRTEAAPPAPAPPAAPAREAGPRSSGRMTLTVPRMARVEAVPVTTAAGDDEDALDGGLLHLKGTGFPWEEGANVFVAGHRIGWPGTRSNLVFYDLHEVRDGDAVILTGPEGREYRYKVYDSFEVAPDRTSVANPVAGKSVLTLQTCTLPDYSRRIIVRAELERSG